MLYSIQGYNMVINGKDKESRVQSWPVASKQEPTLTSPWIADMTCDARHMTQLKSGM